MSKKEPESGQVPDLGLTGDDSEAELAEQVLRQQERHREGGVDSELDLSGAIDSQD
jgi:hypothetical protein